MGLHLRSTLEQLEDRTLLTACSTTGTVPPGFVQLDYAGFHASGRGDVTTQGTIADGSNQLDVADPSTWCIGHGIRVLRAGGDFRVHNADTVGRELGGWDLAPGAPAGSNIFRDETDKIEGDASVHGTFAGPAPGGPLDLFEVVLSDPINLQYDELRFWIKSATATRSGDLRIRVYNPDCPPPFDPGRCATFELELPALEAGKWTELFVELKRRTGRLAQFLGGHQIVTLQWQGGSDALDVRLDDFWLVKDLVAEVQQIQGTTFILNVPVNVPFEQAASQEVVYHDDTLALVRWLQVARDQGRANLFAPPGIYYISASGPIYNNTHILGASADLTTFKDTGRSRTGGAAVFSTLASGVDRPEHITIESTGFDRNGYNGQDFSDIILITGPSEAQDIQIRGNKFFDSNLPGLEGCDRSQDHCVTRQRHYILVLNVNGAIIEDNQLSGGGRIKAAGPGRNILIRNNFIDFVNDNGITIVDAERDCVHSPIPCLTDHVEITDNTIINAVSAGIFFGADGATFDDAGMVLREVRIERNRISGFFGTAAIVGVLPGGGATGVRISENFIEAHRDRAPVPEETFTAGILLSRGDQATQPTADIRVRANAVVASGEHTTLPSGGMFFSGPISDLTVIGNQIRCDACLNIQRGMWFLNGAVDNVEIAGNTVDGTTNAIQAQTSLTGVDIHDNQFVNSMVSGVGQVSIYLDQAQRAEARIFHNTILGGAGHGIYTYGNGRFDLSISRNLIARNGGDGVRLEGGTGILISQNSIFNNGVLGIDLKNDGVTANDPLDADDGPNQLQNFARIISAIRDRSRTRVRGTINTNPTSDVTIEFFVNPTCDESGYGEGRIFVSRTVVRHVAPSDSPDGDREFTAKLERLPAGWFLTATATDGRGNTSEFSQCATIESIDSIRPGAAAFSARLRGVNRFPAAPAGTGYRAHTRAAVPPFVSREPALMSGAPQLRSAKTSRATSATSRSLAWLPLQAVGMARDHQPNPRQQHARDEMSAIDSLLDSGLALTDLRTPM